MKKLKLITLGIGSLLAASTSAVALVSCGTTQKSKDQNDDPIGNDTYWTDINKADQPSKFPASEIGPAERKFPATPIGPSTPIDNPATEDVTSNFKAGVWTMPSDPSYQRKYFAWENKDGKTSIPPIGDYILKFQTVDESGNKFTFDFTLHIDEQTGSIPKTANILGPDGTTKLMANYTGNNSVYPETSGQIYLDYQLNSLDPFKHRSAKWWPYGAVTTLESAQKVNLDSPQITTTNFMPNLIKTESATGYYLKDGMIFSPNKFYKMEMYMIVDDSKEGGPSDSEITLEMVFKGSSPFTNRIYNKTSSIQARSGIYNVRINTNGFYNNNCGISVDGPALKKINVLSLEELSF